MCLVELVIMLSVLQNCLEEILLSINSTSLNVGLFRVVWLVERLTRYLFLRICQFHLKFQTCGHENIHDIPLFNVFRTSWNVSFHSFCFSFMNSFFPPSLLLSPEAYQVYTGLLRKPISGLLILSIISNIFDLCSMFNVSSFSLWH